MRVALLNHNVKGEGTYWRCFSIARELVEIGHEVWLYTIADHDIGWQVKEIENDGVREVLTPRVGGGDYRKYMLFHGTPLDLTLRVTHLLSLDVDLVHAFEHKPICSLPAILKREKDGTPYISDWSDLWGRGGMLDLNPLKYGSELLCEFETRLEEEARLRADAVTVISDFLYERTIALGIERRKVMKLPSGADVGRIPSVEKVRARDRFGIDRAATVLLFAGNALHDISCVNNAYSEVVRNRTDVVLLLAGHKNGFERAGIVESDRIRLLGHVTDSYGEVLKASDIMLIPYKDSGYNRSRWPNKAGDAIAASLPIITHLTGELGKIVKESSVGIAVRDDREFSGAIAELISHPEVLSTYSRNMVALQQTFAWSSIVSDLNKFYKNIGGESRKLSNQQEHFHFVRREGRKLAIVQCPLDKTMGAVLPLAHLLGQLGYRVWILCPPNLAQQFLRPIKFEVAQWEGVSNTRFVAEFIESHDMFGVVKGTVCYTDPGESVSFKFDGDAVSAAVKQAESYIRFGDRLIDELSPDLVVVWGGMFYEARLLSDICRMRSIPVFATEYTFVPECIHFEPEGYIGNNFRFARVYDGRYRWRRLLKKERDIVRKFVEGNYTGKVNHVPPISPNDIRQKMGLVDDDIVLVLGQCFGDTVVTMESPYKTPLEFYRRIVEICRRRRFGHVVLAVHPWDWYGVNVIREFFSNVEGVSVVHRTINTYSLMDVASIGVTLNSQAGLEMAAKYKPVVTGASPFYSNKGFTFDAFHEQQLEMEMERAVSNRLMNDEARESVDKFIYFLMSDCFVNLKEKDSALNTLKRRIEAWGAEY